MPSKARNSEWERRMQELRTDQGLVRDALRHPSKFQAMMKRYHRPVMGYVICILLRHKLASNENAAVEAAKLIWEELIRTLPEKLARMGMRKQSFRDLLRKGIHIAIHSWSKPITRALISTGPDDDKAWKDEERKALLEKALEKLKSYQREHEVKGNLYYVIFRLWDRHREDSLDELNDRLAALPGGRRLDPQAFRKALSRARDQFGKSVPRGRRLDR